MTVEQNDSVVYVHSLCKAYRLGESDIEVLKDVNLNVARGKFVVICGPSGSGKTTLLNIISGIDRPTSGQVIVLGQDLTIQDEDFLAQFRCDNVGFVFQFYNLVSTLTVAENVAFPMEWSRKPETEIEKRVPELVEIVGLQHRANHFPAQLSGGEQQRVAFARALANDPQLILADEPTGNLDTKNGKKITQMLRMLKANEKTIFVATHDPEIMQLADQTLCLEDGRVASQNE
ncbi:MAG: ABC transporter ATP-binding protein [Candidatus Bathyarchaeota archaeon]|nr:MAG: ABC transporter ATP-binding protein [Candidatus Bathyarchaeota archaeon]